MHVLNLLRSLNKVKEGSGRNGPAESSFIHHSIHKDTFFCVPPDPSPVSRALSPRQVLAPDKTEHTLLVQWPKVEEHLAKADAGALGSVIDQALDDGSRSPSAPMDGRRRSMTEMEVRDSISGTGEVKPENSEALADSAGRKRWTSLKTSKSR